MSEEYFEAKEICNALIQISDLVRSSSLTSTLAHVLTALRGPDGPEGITRRDDIKDATTGIIRYRAFGDCAFGIVTLADSQEYVDIRRQLEHDNEQVHFMHHAYQAFRVLGLDWFSDNGSIVPLNSRDISEEDIKRLDDAWQVLNTVKKL